MLQGGLSFVEQNADYAVVGTKLGSPTHVANCDGCSLELLTKNLSRE